MNGSEGLKKPKREIESMEEDQEQQNPEKSCRTDDNDGEGISGRDEEEALVALIEHRTTEVEHLRNRISYYQSQVRPLFVDEFSCKFYSLDAIGRFLQILHICCYICCFSCSVIRF